MKNFVIGFVACSLCGLAIWLAPREQPLRTNAVDVTEEFTDPIAEEVVFVPRRPKVYPIVCEPPSDE